MPMIKIFGRRWNFASDDLVIMSIISSIWRLVIVNVLTLGALIPLIRHQNDTSGPVQLMPPGGNDAMFNAGNVNHDFEHYTYACFIACHVGIMLLEMTVGILAGKGGVFDIQRRRGAVLLFSFKLAILSPVELLLDCVAIYALYRQTTSMFTIGLAIAVTLSLIDIITLIVLSFITFDPIVWIRRSGRLQWANRLWRLRLVCATHCCCIPYSDSNSMAFDSIAEMMSKVFGAHDLVVSDVLAALILLSQRRHDEPKFSGNEQILANVAPADWMTKENALHYYRHALSIYTWPIYVYLHDKKVDGVKWLWSEYIPLSSCPGLATLWSTFNSIVGKDDAEWKGLSEEPEFGGTRFTSLDLKAFRLLMPDQHSCQICYLDLDQRIFRTPFSIAVDHGKRSVIVVLRGTMSVCDLMTDMCAASRHFRFGNVNGQCHLGIYEVASGVFKELMQENLLGTVMMRYKDYQLVICGHSLGAGAAVTLTLMIRDIDEFSNAICYAFSCPRCVTAEVAKACEQFVFCATLGNDIVPRLSIKSISELKQDMINILRVCPIPKYVIFMSTLRSTLEHRLAIISDQLDDQNRLEDDHEFNHSVQIISDHSMDSPDMYVPGVIMHLKRRIPRTGFVADDDLSGRLNNEPVSIYDVKFLDTTDFQTIDVHPRMFRDHLPHALLNALEAICKPFSFATLHQLIPQSQRNLNVT